MTKSAAPTVDWVGRIAKFQDESLGGPSAGFDWWGNVKKVEYKGSGLLTVATDIAYDADGRAVAKQVCNAYSTIRQEYSEVQNVWVMGAQGGTIASC